MTKRNFFLYVVFLVALLGPSAQTATAATWSKDTFTGAEGTRIWNHRSDSGHGWTDIHGDMTISNNMIRATVNGSNARVNTDLFADGLFQAAFNLGSDGVNRGGSIRFRYSDNANFLFAKLYRSASGSSQRVELWQRRNNQHTRLASTWVSLNANTWYTLKVVTRGTLIEIYVNGSKRLTSYQSFNQYARQVCLGFENTIASGQRIDSFTAYIP